MEDSCVPGTVPYETFWLRFADEKTKAGEMTSPVDMTVRR